MIRKSLDNKMKKVGNRFQDIKTGKSQSSEPDLDRIKLKVLSHRYPGPVPSMPKMPWDEKGG